jgi:hypothetical protein
MESESMNTKELGVVCQSKNDMYKVLQVTGDIYLPPVEQANYEFIAQLVSGEKEVCVLLAIMFRSVLPMKRSRLPQYPISMDYV